MNYIEEPIGFNGLIDNTYLSFDFKNDDELGGACSN
jgi:hypothetical protein